MSKTNKKTEIVEITDMNNLGYGVARTENGKVVFVGGTVSGDRVRISFIKETKSYSVGKIEEFISFGEHRAETHFCNAPNACGGCVYRHIDYGYELELKKKYVENSFKKAGLPSVAVKDVLTTGEQSGYRNKGQYPVGICRGQAVSGFFAPKSHKVIPTDKCSLAPDIFAEIVDFTLDFINSRNISVYDEEKKTGLVRHIYIRQGKNTGEIMLCLVINGDTLPESDTFVSEATKRYNIASLLLNINRVDTNLILGDRFVTLYGKDSIDDILCGKRIRIAPDSFYQVNHDGAELLYKTAEQYAELKEGDTLLDLYCGAGTVGISMSDKAERLIGIEIVESAVECARHNARVNGIERAEYFCGDASDTDGIISRIGTEPDKTVVVLDPPRKGCTEKLINTLNERGFKRIVYISCNPDTLARDCKLFSDLGYSISDVTPVDMFPRTGHVESVVGISRKDK